MTEATKPTRRRRRTSSGEQTPPLPSGAVWRGNPDLIPLLVPIETLHNDPDNLRVHGDRSQKAVTDSLRQFGQQKPIVVREEDGVVLAGNGTLNAAIGLGWTHIARVRFDGDTVQERGYKHADNRSAELSEWDWEGLGSELGELKSYFDLGDLGWLDHEVEPLLTAEWAPTETKGLNEFNPPGGGGGGESGSSGKRRIDMTDDQYHMFERVATAVRAREGNSSLTDADVLIHLVKRSEVWSDA